MKRLNLILPVTLFFILPLIGISQSLFDGENIIEFNLSGPVKSLFKDREGDPQYFPFKLNYTDESGNAIELPVKVRTRGHFRRMKGNCTYPPVLINFSKETVANTIFKDQDKLKLVTPCQNDRYVVQEYMVYKIYNLITPMSFKARLVKFTFQQDDKIIGPLMGMVIEEEDQMAKRNEMGSVEGKIIRPEQTDEDNFLTMALFEYMIGNTDWSVQYLQNIKLIAKDGELAPYTVPYDFDHAGIVGAPYAMPAEELLLSSTKERRYRGYCIEDIHKFDHAIEKFNAIKDEVYSLFTNDPLLTSSYKKTTLKFIDDFYKTLDDPKTLKSELQYPCRPDGTGNVVIKGLRKEN